MNPLELLKDKLKLKPDIDTHKPVVVNVQEIKEKDSGKKASKISIVDKSKEAAYDTADLKRRLFAAKLVKTTVKVPLALPKEAAVSKAPPMATKKVEKSKATKIKPILVLEDDSDEEAEERTAALLEEAEDLVPEEDLENVEDVENVEEVIIPEKTKVRKTREKPVKVKGIVVLPPEAWVNFGETPVVKRLTEQLPPVDIKVSSYYMNNREIFVNFLNALFEPYKKLIDSSESNITCDNIGKGATSFDLLTHQKVIRDYMNLYTPYRGLLLYHGLGSGKTCSSIAIAEGMKTGKKVIVMTPASLRRNYLEELKKCGDSIYKKNQYWEWISLDTHMESLETFSSVLNLPQEYIRKKKGVWFVDVTKPSNYADLTADDKENLDDQIDKMIEAKYTFINYNGIRRARLAEMTGNFSRNLFDNSVVVIDEAHNFISRIVNKLEKEKPVGVDNRGEQEQVNKALSLILYQQLLRANNCRIVLLTGTPIINYPNEIGILFNILRGYIKTWEIPIKTKKATNIQTLQKMFLREKVIDYIDYTASNETLLVTRNPFGFKNKIKEKTGYHGVTGEKKMADGFSGLDTDFVSDDSFERRILGILAENDIEVISSGVKIHNYTALPEKLDEFLNRFIDPITKQVKDINVFKRRIIGLTSYFRSAQEELLPRYERTPEYYHVLNIPMSDYQFKAYESARKEERKMEKSKKGQKGAFDASGLFKDAVSTYRIFSRLFCNFVMPVPPGRPMPERERKATKKAGEEGDGEAGEGGELAVLLKEAQKKANAADLEDNDEAEIEGDAALEAVGGVDYKKRIDEALTELKAGAAEYLSPEGLETYSPKFLAMLENITDEDHMGLHLVYSQFRTLEGVGVFKLVLEENGFTQFKLKKSVAGMWELDIKEEDAGKPTFALYTGTETSDEKEIIRNIYNGDWDYIPTNIADQLKEIHLNNNMGEIIKVLMITSSGSEGINLRNTRYVHIMEPYWHPVRTEQVIGRARRICSHKELPEALQTVEVFLYLMTFTEKQKTGDESIELKIKDLSKREPKVPLTSDEFLYEICTIKEEINSQLVKAVKEAAIDCVLYSKGGKEGLQCLTFGDAKNTKFSYAPSIDKQPSDSIEAINKEKIEWTGKPIDIQGVKYIRREMVKGQLYKIYDFDSFQDALEGNGQPRQIGTLEIKSNGQKVFKTGVE